MISAKIGSFLADISITLSSTNSAAPIFSHPIIFFRKMEMIHSFLPIFL